jgi:FAD/FMN-containing dehydrogenase
LAEVASLQIFDKAHLYEIIKEFEHDGGMKEIDTNQIDFKKIADPHGLMNPGKTLGWLPEYASR